MQVQVMMELPYFIITVDTEADDAWNRPDQIELTNLAEIPRFQELCEKYGVFPTYLVTYECATREEALSVLKPFSDAGRCEIGHHLHCWTTPPFAKEGPSNVDSAWIQAYQSELPDSLFREKAEALYSAIGDAFGKPPTSHRAGRWGIDQRGIDWLTETGFLVDSSVVPLATYTKNLGRTRGGPSFYTSSLKPYFWPSSVFCGNMASFLMEIPLTVPVPERYLSKILAKYLGWEIPGSNMAGRLYRRTLGGQSMLRPDPRYPNGALLKIVQGVIKHKLPVLNMIIHSSELSLGCSPFSRTADACARVWNKLEIIFKYIKQLNINSVSLSEAAILLKGTAM